MVLPPDTDPLTGLFTLTQRSWLYANMDYDEYAKLGDSMQEIRLIQSCP